MQLLIVVVDAFLIHFISCDEVCCVILNFCHQVPVGFVSGSGGISGTSVKHNKTKNNTCLTDNRYIITQINMCNTLQVHSGCNNKQNGQEKLVMVYNNRQMCGTMRSVVAVLGRIVQLAM